MKSSPLEIVFRIWYRYVNSKDKKAEVTFMNYGYAAEGEEIKLEGENEINRYSIQLYNHLAVEAELKGKDLVEIGSGRGGGLAFITDTYKPKSVIGVELDRTAVGFCNKKYSQKNLTFIHGDAQQLSLEDNSCDVVINVESSHRYPEFHSFLSEVKRVLRPGGFLLYTDFRNSGSMEKMESKLKACGLKILKERNINKEVVKALDLDDKRRRDLVHKLTPWFVHRIGRDFAGCIGSPTYKKFVKKKFVYYSYVLQKEEA